MTTFGVHTGCQKTTVAELIPLWRQIEALGFEWISIWDHLYAADATGSPDNLEAVSTHTALAMATERVRVGSLVYSVGFRHPAVLARAIANIDLISGGRAELGLGAGWLRSEYDAHGLAFGSARQRLDALDDAALIVRGLLDGDTVTHDGPVFRCDAAQLAPLPAQAHLPLTIGGGGEKRTLAIVARRAQAWNVPFLAPEVFAAKRAVLVGHCDAIGRDPASLHCSVNVGYARDDDHLRAQFGVTAEFVRPGVLMGDADTIRARVAEYAAAGADRINLAIRAPFDSAAVEEFAALVL